MTHTECVTGSFGTNCVAHIEESDCDGVVCRCSIWLWHCQLTSNLVSGSFIK